MGIGGRKREGGRAWVEKEMEEQERGGRSRKERNG